MMKKILLILLCLPMIGFGQQTYVPDDNFEAWIETTYPAADNGISNDNYVLTAGLVDYQFTLTPNNSPGPIFDLTGIEDFIIYDQLYISDILATSIDLSELITTPYSTIISNNQYLEEIILPNNYDTLTTFTCWRNDSLNSIIFQTNATYRQIDIACNSNLCELNFKGKVISQTTNSSNGGSIVVRECPKLFKLDFSGIIEAKYQTQIVISSSIGCLLSNFMDTSTIYINLDNPVSIYNWTLVASGNFIGIINVSSNSDANYCSTSNDWNFTNATYCTGCYAPPINCQGVTSIQEHSTNKELLKVTDLLGRETKGTKNEILFYIYDDGTVEKRIIIE